MGRENGKSGRAPQNSPSATWTALRIVIRIVIIGLIVWLVHVLVVWSDAQTAALKSGVQLRSAMLFILLGTYALLIAIPFIPGVELGIGLMVVEGARIAPMIYLATVLGLIAAYLVGAGLSEARLRNALADFRLQKLAGLIDRIGSLGPADRLALLEARLPHRLAKFGVQYRYVALGILINMPGNSIAGGGGGLLFAAGFSRLFSVASTILTVLIAVSPVPLIVWISGAVFPSWH